MGAGVGIGLEPVDGIGAVGMVPGWGIGVGAGAAEGAGVGVGVGVGVGAGAAQAKTRSEVLTESATKK